MASKTESLRYLIEAIWKGGGATAAASREISEVGKAADGSSDRLQSFGDGLSELAVIAGDAVAVLGTVKAAMGLAFEGAEIERTRERFEALAASIGKTGDSLMGSLRAATQGLVTDAELMASAGDIIRLGLADTEDGIIRLANLIAKSGWDMQTVIMTFANDSRMRLDALGLSVTDVEERMKKYTDAGKSASEAFDLAVIEAGEEKLKTFGDQAETTAGQLQILTNRAKTFTDEFKSGFAVGFASNASEELGGISGALGLTTAELGRFLGLLLSPEPQRALDFLEQLKSDAAGADQAMLQMARQGGLALTETIAEIDELARSRGQRGGLLGNLIGDPGESLADLQARIEAINAPMREMIRLRDEAARAATTERRQEFGGFIEFDTTGLGDANAVMLETATNAGAAAEQLYALMGGGEAAGDALIAAAGKARAAKLGEAIAAGLITAKDAAQDLQDFMAGLTLEDVFKLDEPIAGSREVVETAKQEMLRVVEGIEPAVTQATAPALDALDAVDEALTLLDEKTATPEIVDNAADSQANLTEFRRYWDENIAGLSTTATVNIVYTTTGIPPEGVPPPPGRARGGPVSAGQVYVVGEKGPELFVPNSSGQVVPGDSPRGMGGGWGGSPVMVNQNFNGLGIAGAIAVSRRVLANYTRGTR